MTARPAPPLTADERRVIETAATFARPGEPIHLEDLAERLGMVRWKLNSLVDKIRVSHPERWPYQRYPKGGSLTAALSALRAEQRGRIYLHSVTPQAPVLRTSFRVIEVVARARRLRRQLTRSEAL